MSQTFDELYIHIPFCVKRCSYCGFYSCVRSSEDARRDVYLSCVNRYLELLARKGFLADLRSVYIGGGTPTLAGKGLCNLIGRIREVAAHLSEVTVEANPDSADRELLCALSTLGVTRISLGVQSTQDTELVLLGRIHNAAQARRAMACIKDLGFDLSCDLILGFQTQTRTSFENSLRDVIDAGADHVSCYPLTVEEGTPLENSIELGLFEEPDPDFQADLMLDASQYLSDAGFKRYEVASYAKPGKQCLHNLGYWSGKTYLGIGPAAASMLSPSLFDALRDDGLLCANPASSSSDRIRFCVAADIDDSVETLSKGFQRTEVFEQLSSRQAAAEDLMLAMRTTSGVSPAFLSDCVARGIPVSVLHTNLDAAYQRGLIQKDAAGNTIPTQRGWLLGNELYGLMWQCGCDD